MNYKELNLKSGDILLCSGDGKLSGLIKSFQKIAGFTGTAAELSHAASIYQLTDDEVERLNRMGYSLKYDFNRLYVFESTTLNKWAGKKGVQINPMYLWLENYTGRVWVRKLMYERTFAIAQMDWTFLLCHLNDKYEHGIPGFFELLFCGLMLSRYIRKVFPDFKPFRTKTPHCTELDAERLKNIGMLKDIAIENRMPPAVWWNTLPVKKLHLETTTLDENLNCRISEPYRIK